MKKIFKTKNSKKAFVGLFIVTMLSATSCSKYTQLNPINSPSETTAFTTPANIELVAAGVYSKGALGFYNATIGGANTPRGYAFGAASIEQEEMRGEDMINLATFYAITYLNTYDATTANNVNMWGNLFSLINQCNVLIAGVETAGANGTITPAAAKSYEGEGRFLRALAYHEAVIMFCRPYLDGNGSNLGVPIHTVAVTNPDAINSQSTISRGTVAQVYTQILADLDYAEVNLPATRSFQISRATSGAAIALKTRVKMHMGDWAGVITEGAKLGTSTVATTYTSPIGGYKLTASPDGPFVTPAANASNTESVFSFENSTAANPGVNAALSSIFGPSSYVSAGAQVTAGRGLVCISPNLYNASYWVTGDLRRSLLLIQAATVAPPAAPVTSYYFTYKYRDYLNYTDWSPIMRYAEVLLNVAEAYSRTSALDPRALALLNAVRNRSVPVASQYTAANFTTQNSLTQAILNERRIEFCAEGRRWGDISRLANDPNFAVSIGIPAKLQITDMNSTGSDFNTTTRPILTPSVPALPYSNFRFVWPIPVTETNANPVLAAQQNPGY